MKTITFGPLTHPDKSYAYALGYGAYHMGHWLADNPYRDKDSERYSKLNSEDYDLGWRTARDDADRKMIEILERRTKGKS